MMTDAMLAQAAAELATAMNESLPDPEDCNHQFSVGFEKKIKKLTRKADHPIYYRTLRSVASILLVITLGFGVVLTVSVEARAAVFGWIKEQYESFYEYFFEGEFVPSETTTYYPGWLPDDCEFVTSYKTAGGEVYVYTDAQDMIIQFSYIFDPESEKMYMDGVEADKRAVSIHGCYGELYVSPNEGETNSIVWTDASQTILFSLSGNYDEDILIKIAENILQK